MILLLVSVCSYLIIQFFLNKHECKCNIGIHILINIVLFIFGSNDLLKYMIYIWLYIIAMIDYKTMYIYDITLLIYMVLMITTALKQSTDLFEIVINFCMVCSFFLLNMDKERIGAGDIYLLLASSICLNIMELWMSILIACTSCLCVMLHQKERSEPFAFAPFLCIGIMIVLYQ